MSHSKQRMGHDLTHRLARILAERVSDPRLGMTSIVEVQPAPDGSFARVFYRTIGDRDEAARALESAKPFIRRCLGENLRMRRVPELAFVYDPAQDRGARVDEILDELRDELPENGNAEDPPRD